MNRAEPTRLKRDSMRLSKGFRYVLLACAAAGLLLSFGCAGKEPKQTVSEDFMTQWKAKAENSAGYSPGAPERESPEPDSETSLPSASPLESSPLSGGEPPEDAPRPSPTALAVPDPERPLPSSPVSLRMRDVDLPTLLRALARIADQNIMISEKVAGKASIDIHQAPWDQVFRGILATHGLDYRWVGDIIRIISVQDLQQQQALMSEIQKAEQAKEEHVLTLSRIQKKAERATDRFSTRVVPIRYAILEKIRANVEKILQTDVGPEGDAETAAQEQAQGQKDYGSVLADEHSHALILRAREKDLPVLLDLIRQLDRPTPQIRIEAHIVQATSQTARALGVQWGGLYLNASGGSFNWYGSRGGGQGENLYNDSELAPKFIQPTIGSVVSAIPEAVGANDADGLSLGYVFQRKGISLLSVQLKALEENGSLSILSSPSISTVDNQQASIESGKEVPFQTVEDGEVKIEFKEALLKLTVTPHVIDKETLRLDVIANNDTLDFANAVNGQPAIDKKKAETNLVLFNGETTVIGGLSITNNLRRESGVPGLKEVPLLGSLFKGKSREKELDELLIFITPFILDERGDESASSSRSQ